MSLDKAIAHGKEKRKPYRGSRRFDKTCRNHGSCTYCVDNRTYSNRKLADAAQSQLKEIS